MFSWLAANLPTIVISAALVLLLALAIRHMYREHKRGGCVGCPGCGNGGCGHCTHHTAGQKHVK